MNVNLISFHQYGFEPGTSFTNQPLLISHKIYKSFDVGLKNRSELLNIYKELGKVWHRGLTLKLRHNEILGNLF